MSEWQPARVRIVHDRSLIPRYTATRIEDLAKRGVIFVRPAPDDCGSYLFDVMGCHSHKFFYVKGEDSSVLCDCELLTD